MAFSASETVDRSPDEVRAFVSDWRRAPAWMPGVESMSRAGDGAPARLKAAIEA